MALQTRAVKDPTTATNRYKAGVQSAGPDWTDGALHPKRDFRTAAAAQQGYWASQVQAAAAKGTFASHIKAVTDAEYENAVSTYGQNNYVTQAQAKAGNWTKFYDKFQPKLAGIVAKLPARGNKAQNRARLNAYLDAVEATAGSNSARG